MSTFAARSFLRSATTSVRSATAARLSSGVKPRAAPPPFRISSQKPLSPRIFRSPVEMSSVSVVSLLPYHSVTASAVLTSMLSIAPCGQGWSIEELIVDSSFVEKAGRQLLEIIEMTDVDKGLLNDKAKDPMGNKKVLDAFMLAAALIMCYTLGRVKKKSRMQFVRENWRRTR